MNAPAKNSNALRTMKKLYVYADFDWLKKEELIGELLIDSLRGKESYGFQFSKEWLKKYGNIQLSNDINNYTGIQYCQQNGDIFGCFADSLPDRWGRTLILRREQILAIEENRPVRRLTSYDFLSGNDDLAYSLIEYKGDIYKTNNMLGRTLAQYCPTDSAMQKEQQRIENELLAFEKNVYGDQAKKDSLDSIAKVKADAEKSGKKKAKKQNNRRSSSSSVSKKQTSKPAKSTSSSAARVSVRRERH